MASHTNITTAAAAFSKLATPLFLDGHTNESWSKPLWSVFSLVSRSSIGVDPLKFDFVPGSTPLSTLSQTALALVVYYTTIFGGQRLMRDRKPFALNTLFKIHNFSLSTASGIMLALFAEQLLPSLYQSGIFKCICGEPGWTRPLVTLYYMNYVTKYIELFDTLFLVLRKKPLTFLHTYHHGATALLCYTQLIGHTSVSWVPITANLLVHVVMYWYYFQAARGVKIWWKQYITQLQIAQFVIDLGFIYFASWTYFASAYAPSLPHVGTCAGEEYAAFAGCIILSSYLVLFIMFYLSTYRRGRSEKQTVKDVAKNMEKTEVKGINQAEAKAEEVVGNAKIGVDEMLADAKDSSVSIRN